MKKFKLNSAFTLVELLVVVAIILILAGIILPNITNARMKSRDSKRISDIGQLQLSLEQFFNRCQGYPSAAPLTTSSNVAGCSYTLGSFISVIPKDPLTSADYSYYVNSGNSDYILKTTLEVNNDALKNSVTTAGEPSWATTAGVVCNAGGTPLVYCVAPQ